MDAHSHAEAEAQSVLLSLLGEGASLVAHEPSGGGRRHPDFVVKAARTFVVEVKAAATASSVASAARQALEAGASVQDAVPLLAVPFMGPVGRRICDQLGVGWFDLSGNAHIVAPGVRILVEGKKNRYAARGRPADPFAPRSSRIARWFLMNPAEHVTQRKLARATGLGEGFVSRLVGRLREGYLGRDDQGALFLREPELFLAAWREAYDFSRHVVRAGFVAARSGDALLRFTADVLGEAGYAATGLAAAWALTGFAAFRLVTLYLPAPPSPELLGKLGFHDEPRGANLWLVTPNDMGVFHGAGIRDGIRCVHPVQAYLDLKAQPERAPEAAERLRTELPGIARRV